MAKTLLVIYLPALHQGYINLFEQTQSDIAIVDNALLKVVPRLERDVRAIKPEVMQSVLRALYPERQSIVLKTLAGLEKIKRDYDAFIMPDEDISHELKEKYLGSHDVLYKNVFLRWDKMGTTKANMPSQVATISHSEFDKGIMTKVFQEAQLSRDWWRQVAAAVIEDKEVILIDHNQSYPDPIYSQNTFGDPRGNFDYGESIELSKVIHAEAKVIAEAARKGISLEGSSIYVSTFPCPVCAKSVAAAGIKKVFYRDGYSLLDAEDIFKAKDIEIIHVAA